MTVMNHSRSFPVFKCWLGDKTFFFFFNGGKAAGSNGKRIENPGYGDKYICHSLFSLQNNKSPQDIKQKLWVLLSIKF